MQVSYWAEVDVATRVDGRCAVAITSSAGCNDSFLTGVSQPLHKETTFNIQVINTLAVL